jgi:hypothetical protein
MGKIRANFFLSPDFFPSRTPMAVMLAMLVMLSMTKNFPQTYYENMNYTFCLAKNYAL